MRRETRFYLPYSLGKQASCSRVGAGSAYPAFRVSRPVPAPTGKQNPSATPPFLRTRGHRASKQLFLFCLPGGLPRRPARRACLPSARRCSVAHFHLPMNSGAAARGTKSPRLPCAPGVRRALARRPRTHKGEAAELPTLEPVAPAASRGRRTE